MKIFFKHESVSCSTTLKLSICKEYSHLLRIRLVMDGGTLVSKIGDVFWIYITKTMKRISPLSTECRAKPSTWKRYRAPSWAAHSFLTAPTT